MFVRQPQFRNSNADVQIFYGTNSIGANASTNWRSWTKPPGVSHVYILLIGAGGNGDGGSGGGSAGIYVWYGAAQNVPDVLRIKLGVGGTTNTEIFYFNQNTAVPSLINGSTPSFAGPASAPDPRPFGASGFTNLVAGQAGNTASASTTTFLSGGVNGTVTANYGYTNPSNDAKGYFLLQPMIVGVGSTGSKNGEFGCGGGFNYGYGGPGMVLIASW